MQSLVLLKSARRCKRVAILATLLFLFAAQLAFSQKKKEDRLRALAVVEMPAPSKNAKGKAAPARVYPIAIFDQGRFFDAEVYKATPVPMALEPGIIYELQESGTPHGDITISTARQINGLWFGDGELRPVVKAKPAPVKLPGEEDAPPRLRRTPGRSSTPTAEPPKSLPPPEDKDRPVLKRGASEENAAPATPEDKNRPVLKRGAGEQTKPDIQTPLATAPVGATYVAISDDAPYDARPYQFHWSKDEQAQLTDEVTGLAERELEKTVSAAAAPNRRKRPGADAAAKLDQVQIRAFDLDTTNDAEVVLSARSPIAGSAAGKQHFRYVTIVARRDVSGDIRKIFSAVTDDQHLDVSGRLELVDAVDADGDNRGELLFRRITDRDRHYELYKVGRDQLALLFEGAGSSQ